MNLTKTKTKGREGKATLIDTIREAVEQYPRLFVFRYRNLRNNALKKLRQEMTSSSRYALSPPDVGILDWLCETACALAEGSSPTPRRRFFLGSNKVMQVALGRDETTEFRPQLQVCAAPPPSPPLVPPPATLPLAFVLTRRLCG